MAAGAETPFETTAEHACFGGVQRFHRHASATIGLPMRFAVYQPPQPSGAALVCLAGLTCTEETFAIKAGAQRLAAKLGLAIVTPDTSPRATGIEGADAAWDFGHGAGFYLDASEAPWSRHFRMESWIVEELRALVFERFALRRDRVGVFGHSMGGHGALTLALRHPSLFQSVSAFAPIAAPTQCPWGEKAFTGYLGEDRARWAEHDATELIQAGKRCPPLLIDQGRADQFLAAQLHPDRLEAASRAAGQPLTLRWHEGYDHGYYFVQSFVPEHLAFHAARLTG
jgi:S-formylglutathione hydrolase